MSNQKQETTGPESFFSAWMKTASEYWETAFQMWPATSKAPQEAASMKTGAAGRAQESWEAVQKTWKTMAAVLQEPPAMDSLFKGIQAMPDVVLKFAQVGWDNFFRGQQKLLEKAGSIGETTKAYQFEDLDQEAFKFWNEIYESEFKQFLNVPQLGLTRFYQERMNTAVDKFNVFQAQMAEFLHVCYLPMDKSFKVMQDKIQELTDKGELPDDANEYYRMWIKVLEGHYMTLLKSPEYSKTLAKTLGALEDYMMARKDVMQDILQFFPVPTQDDVDDLYREIYLLKKKIKALEKTK
jgi:hypothetical protein